MELGKFWSKVRYQLTPYTDKSFRVDEVYIHKYEVMDLISLLSFFPELSDIFEEISLKYLNDTQTQMHGKINENS